MRKEKTHSKRKLQTDFMSSLAKEFKKQPIVNDEDVPRTLRAIDLLKEYIRMFYECDRTLVSLNKIAKCARSFIVLEKCDQKKIQDAVHDAELLVLKESEEHMTGLNGMELALMLKKSQFDDIKKEADILMDTCAYKRVISNGLD